MKNRMARNFSSNRVSRGNTFVRNTSVNVNRGYYPSGYGMTAALGATTGILLGATMASGGKQQQQQPQQPQVIVVNNQIPQ